MGQFFPMDQPVARRTLVVVHAHPDDETTDKAKGPRRCSRVVRTDVFEGLA